jgi:NADPH:quinone reductase-like Zn-dependent oxidoreductase
MQTLGAYTQQASACKEALAANGTFVSIHKVSYHIRESAEDLVFLKELIEAGKLRAVIDRTYTLEQIVEAHRYVEKERKIGKCSHSFGA